MNNNKERAELIKSLEGEIANLIENIETSKKLVKSKKETIEDLKNSIVREVLKRNETEN